MPSHHTGAGVGVPAGLRLSVLCLDMGGQAVEQEVFGPGQADREEERDLICPGRGDLASADCSQGDEPLVVRGTGQHVRRVVGADLVHGVGDQQRRGVRQVQAELGPALLFGAKCGDIGARGNPGSVDNRGWGCWWRGPRCQRLPPRRGRRKPADRPGTSCSARARRSCGAPGPWSTPRTSRRSRTAASAHSWV